MEGYSDEDLRAAGLSDEEVLAMQEDGAPQAETPDAEVPQPVPGAGKPEGDDGKGGAPAEVAVPEGQNAQPGGEVAAPVLPEGGTLPVPEQAPLPGEEKAPAAAKPSSMPVDPFAPKFVAPEMTKEAYDASLADLKKQAQEEYLDPIEYADRVADLKAQYAIAQFAQQNNAATGEQKWQYAQDAFKSVHPEYENPILWGALDAVVRQLSSDEAVKKMTDIAFLALAHERVQEALGLNKPAEAPPADPAKAEPRPTEAAVPAAPERQPALERDKDKIPPSLGGLPAAQSSQPEGEFSDMAKLEGMDLESAVASLQKANPAKYERYLRGGA